MWVGPNQRDLLAAHANKVKAGWAPLLRFFEQWQPVLLPPAVAVALGSIGLWLWFEWRASGLRNRARLGMAPGATALGASFLVFSPLKCFIAYGFSHAAEYIVFVWAFQRRRYLGEPLAHKPLIGRALRASPVIFYGIALGSVVAASLYLDWWDDHHYDGEMRILDVHASVWLLHWTVWSSFMHFYCDGFLWKMRLPSVRASI